MAGGSDTRERLLEAAIDVLAEDGLAGFTHRRIEDRAGVSHGSTTYHFGNREALYDATIERVLQIEAQLSADAVADVFGGGPTAMLDVPFDWSIDWNSPEGIELMRRFAAASIDRLRGSRRTLLAKFEMYLEAARTPGGRARLADARGRVYAAQEEQARVLGYPNPALYSRAVPALVEGFLVHDLSVPDEVITQRAGDALVLLLSGLYNAPPDPRQAGSEGLTGA